MFEDESYGLPQGYFCAVAFRPERLHAANLFYAPHAPQLGEQAAVPIRMRRGTINLVNGFRRKFAASRKVAHNVIRRVVNPSALEFG